MFSTAAMLFIATFTRAEKKCTDVLKSKLLNNLSSPIAVFLPSGLALMKPEMQFGKTIN